MCGIAGKLDRRGNGVTEGLLRRMLGAIRHRGPDQFGIYLDRQIGMGNARLSIIDLGNGQQPICNEDGSLWIVFNGEIFNYIELRADLLARGHVLGTKTDTETILHLYEELGPECLQYLNGQFAMAIWDAKREELFLSRDRLGVRPLFYTDDGSRLLFASEIKALLASDEVPAELDLVSLDQVFTYWSTLSPRTMFRGIRELPPGHFLLAKRNCIRVQKYWEVAFDQGDVGAPIRQEREYLDELHHLLVEATRLRLRADVPVGAYLSGGLDSSIIASIVRNHAANRLDTFSISFSDDRFDESEFQRCMARHLQTEHQVVHATHGDIGRVFPDVIWHVETALMRTSPAPMFLLSRLVKQRGFKVVLTGEGADEFLGGYDIFKEMKVRRFWAHQPESKWRHRLLKRLYPDIRELSLNSDAFASAFFGRGLCDTHRWDYSHHLRWETSRRCTRFFSESTKQRIREEGKESGNGMEYPADFNRWGDLEKAQYLEISVFLSQYLLSSQGDRVAMANSVEGRFPFLDYRVIEFCNRLPSRLKLRGLTEKYLLKQLGKQILPTLIWSRSKRPYRAPIHRSFFNDSTEPYVDELLSPRAIQKTGIFNPAAVSQLAGKARNGLALGETDDMALAGILSTQLLHHQFVADFRNITPLSDNDDVKLCRGNYGGKNDIQ